MISIIVPTYNCAHWITDCIESVLAQTFTDWELIVVDDQSSDNSVEIITEYAEKDPRIRLIKATHGGLAYVRNIGIDDARGHFITFLDSDDLWLPDTLRILYEALTLNQADMSAAGYMKFQGEDFHAEKKKCETLALSAPNAPTRVISGQQAVEESLYQSGMHSSMSAKLYKMSLFEGIRLTPGEIYEDLNVFYLIAMRCKRIAVIDLPLYLYRQRVGSILHVFNRQRLDVLTVTERIEKYIRCHTPALIPAARDRRFSANFNMLIEISRYLRSEKVSEDDRAFFNPILHSIISFLKKNAAAEMKNPHVRLKNKAGAFVAWAVPSNLLLRFLK